MEAARTQDTNDRRDQAILAPWGSEQVQEVHGAVAMARAAQPQWAARPLRERLALVRRGRHALAANANALALAIGNARRVEPAEALVSEVLPLADACRFLEREAERTLAPQHPRTKNRPLWLRGVALEVRREPFGVILIIAPANYPLFLPGVQVLQALVAGNAVVLKPGSGWQWH